MRESTRRAFQEVKELPELTPAENHPGGPVRVIVLASGSKGNSIVIAYGKHAVIIDAGISPEEACRLSRSVGCPLTSSSESNSPGNAVRVDAVLLTHWHKDHCAHIIKTSSDLRCPVVCSQATLIGLETQPWKHRRANNGEMLDALATDSPFEVIPIKIAHEEGSLAFHVRVAGKNILVAHDIACANSSLLAAARAADCLLIEANHNPERIANCTLADHRPDLHANILSNDRGHFSNAQAAEVVSHVDPARIQAICATHLSDTHNDEAEAEEVIRGSIPEGAHPNIYIARQDSPVLIEVNGGPSKLELSLLEQFRVLDRKVDAIIEEQKNSDHETNERRMVIGEYMTEMKRLFQEKDPGAKLEGFEFFDHWRHAKARLYGVSARTLYYYQLDTETVVPLIGRDAAKELPIGTISELGKFAKAKGEITPEILQFAQEHPAHEVKALVASKLYPGKSGHFDGPEDFLSITAGKQQIAHLRKLLDEARPLAGVSYDKDGAAHEATDAEVIEYALVEFIQSHSLTDAIADGRAATDIPPAPDISEFLTEEAQDGEDERPQDVA